MNMEHSNKDSIRDAIFDLVYDELPHEKALETIDLIREDKELWSYYQQMKKDKELLDKAGFKEADGFILENARGKLFDKLASEKKSGKIIDFTNVVKQKYEKGFIAILKYAAVIAVTIFASQAYFTKDLKTTLPIQNSPFVEEQDQINPVAYDRYENTLDLDRYNLSDVNVTRQGEEVTLEFDVSTRKIVKGKQDDPNIVYTLDQIMRDQNNPAIKLRTMKVLDEPRDAKLQNSLISVMLNDDNPAVRRKAFKVLTKGAITEDVKNSLMKLIKNDKDSNLKIEALEILENYDKSLAKSAVSDVSKDSELYEFKSILNDK